MKEHKKQVWFRADQVDLVQECLVFAKNRADEPNNLVNQIDKMAKRVLVRRINEVLALFVPKT